MINRTFEQTKETSLKRWDEIEKLVSKAYTLKEADCEFCRFTEGSSDKNCKDCLVKVSCDKHLNKVTSEFIKLINTIREIQHDIKGLEKKKQDD